MASQTAPPPTTPDTVLTFLRLLSNLKTTKRTGWLNSSIPHPESISDHMYRMSIISLIHPHSTPHLIKLALAHDIAECIVGDITPYDPISKESKSAMEDDAMCTLRDTLGGTAGVELYQLWREYEDAVTAEARVMKEIDKFEMILQADEYERMHDVSLQQFFDSTDNSFSTAFITSLNEQLRSQREERLSRNTTSSDVS